MNLRNFKPVFLSAGRQTGSRHGMIDTAEPKDKIFRQPLGDEHHYIRALTARYPGLIEFETGAGHVFNDLVARLPTIPQLDKSKRALCNRIAELVYPLAACLLTQEVAITIIVSAKPLPPPHLIAGLATYTVFDAEQDVMRHCFMTPNNDDDIGREGLALHSGVAVLCEPLNYHSHHAHSSGGGLSQRPQNEVFDWTAKMINQFYDLKAGSPFMAERVRLRTSILNGAQILGIVETGAIAGLANAGDVNFQNPGAQQSVTTAFMHEAGYAETSSSLRAPISPRVTTQPASTPAQTKDLTTAKPQSSPSEPLQKPDAEPVDAHQHLTHRHFNPSDPEMN